MAMGVDDDVGRFCVECKSVGIVGEDGVNEALEKEAATGDVFGVRQAQFAIIFGEHRPARWFQEKDWSGASFAKSTAARGVLV